MEAPCPKCKKPVEIPSVGSRVVCNCGREIRRVSEEQAKRLFEMVETEHGEATLDEVWVDDDGATNVRETYGEVPITTRRRRLTDG